MSTFSYNKGKCISCNWQNVNNAYVNYLTETITMQMANRMDKDPEVRYFPIEDNTPLSDYVTIGAACIILQYPGSPPK